MHFVLFHRFLQTYKPPFSNQNPTYQAVYNNSFISKKSG